MEKTSNKAGDAAQAQKAGDAAPPHDAEKKNDVVEENARETAEEKASGRAPNKKAKKAAAGRRTVQTRASSKSAQEESDSEESSEEEESAPVRHTAPQLQAHDAGADSESDDSEEEGDGNTDGDGGKSSARSRAPFGTLVAEFARLAKSKLKRCRPATPFTEATALAALRDGSVAAVLARLVTLRKVAARYDAQVVDIGLQAFVDKAFDGRMATDIEDDAQRWLEENPRSDGGAYIDRMIKKVAQMMATPGRVVDLAQEVFKLRRGEEPRDALDRFKLRSWALNRFKMSDDGERCDMWHRSEKEELEAFCAAFPTVARDYAHAHKIKSALKFAKKMQVQMGWREVAVVKASEASDAPDPRPVAAAAAQPAQPSAPHKQTVRCFRCKEEGHVKAECTKRAKCYACDGFGHLADHCNTVCGYCRLTGHGEAHCQKKKDERAKKSNNKPNQYAAGGAHKARKRGAAKGIAAQEVPAPLVPHSATSAGARRATDAAEHAVLAAAWGPKDRIWAETAFGGVNMWALIDSGANSSIIGDETLRGARAVYSDLGLPVKSMEVAGGRLEAVAGTVRVRLELGAQSVLADVLVIGGFEGLILGSDVLARMEVMHAIEETLQRQGVQVRAAPSRPVAAAVVAAAVEREGEARWYELPEEVALADLSHLPPRHRERLRAILVRHHKCFLRQDALPPPCNAPPIRLFAPDRVEAIMKARPWSAETRAELARHERKELAYGVVEHVEGQSSRDVRAEPLLVPKGDNETRKVVDFTAINPKLHHGAHPTTDMRQEQEKMRGRRFSKLDLGAGFFSVRLDEESKALTQHRASDGKLLVYTRLPMGVRPAIAEFERVIKQNLIARFPEAMQETTAHYVDDLGAASGGAGKTEREQDDKAIEQQIAWIEAALEAAAAGGHVYKRSKCAFAVEEMEWCGAVFSKDGRKPAPDRVRAVLNFGEIKTKKHAQSYLGMVEGFRAHVPHFADMLLPIRDTCKGRGPLAWSPEAREARAKVDAAIEKCGRNIVAVPGRPYTLRVDASNIGLGATLEQDGKVVRYWSRALTAPERDYSASDKEQLAIVCGLEEMEMHVGGCRVHVDVLSDHKAHAGSQSTGRRDKQRSAMRARWHERLQRFDYEVSYAPRADQAVVDALAKSPAFEAKPGDDGRVDSAALSANLEARREVPIHSDPLSAAGPTSPPPLPVAASVRQEAGARAGGEETKRRPPILRRGPPRKAPRPISFSDPVVTAEASSVLGEQRSDNGRGEREAVAAELEPRRQVHSPSLSTASAPAPAPTLPARAAPARMQAAALDATTPVRPEAAAYRAKQLRDPRAAALIRYLEAGTTGGALAHQAKGMAVIGGVLYLRGSDELGKEVLRVYVADVDGWREEELRRAHGQLEGSGVEAHAEVGPLHEGSDKMYTRLKRDRYWPGMQRACAAHAAQCHWCKLPKKIDGGAGLLAPTTSRMLRGKRRACADLAGPLPKSKEGYDYAMVIVDADSHYKTVVPMRGSEGREVVRAFCDGWVQHRGVPDEILTDRASNIGSELAQAIYRDLGMKQLQTTSYHPQANGRAENVVKQFKQTVTKLLEERGGEWPDYVWLINVKFNSACVEPFEMSPFKVENGREMRLPAAFSTPIEKLETVWTTDMHKIAQIVDKRRDEAAARYKKEYDKEHYAAEFNEGDRVWWTEHAPATTLDKKRDGPYRIKRVIAREGDENNPLTVELEEFPQGPKIGQRHNIVSVKHIEKYEQVPPVMEEQRVLRITKQQRSGRKKQSMRYWVVWENGDEGWEPERNLVDKGEDGGVVEVEALVEFKQQREQKAKAKEQAARVAAGSQRPQTRRKQRRERK